MAVCPCLTHDDSAVKLFFLLNPNTKYQLNFIFEPEKKFLSVNHSKSDLQHTLSTTPEVTDSMTAYGFCLFQQSKLNETSPAEISKVGVTSVDSLLGGGTGESSLKEDSGRDCNKLKSCFAEVDDNVAFLTDCRTELVCQSQVN